MINYMFGELGKNPSPRWDLNPRPSVRVVGSNPIWVISKTNLLQEKNRHVICRLGSVRIGKNCDRGLKMFPEAEGSIFTPVFPRQHFHSQHFHGPTQAGKKHVNFFPAVNWFHRFVIESASAPSINVL